MVNVVLVSISWVMAKNISTDKVLYINDMLVDERQALADVMDSIERESLLSENINDTFQEKLTLGDRIADEVAEFAGSRKFILSFSAFLVLWMFVNTVLLFQNIFDPYPFILLNLILSTIAAFQWPVIMMSQNRQETRDRLRAENDYKINLKAEVEIRNLHEKIDHLLIKKWENLIEIQQIQLEIMQQSIWKAATKIEDISVDVDTNI